MSNLLKHHYVRNDYQGTVIINSNERAERLLRDVLKAQSVGGELAGNDGSGEFSAGLDISAMHQNADQILAEARQEAEIIVDQAKRKAESIVNDANGRAMNVYEERSRAGYNEGMEKAEKAKSELLQQLEDEFCQKKQELESSLKMREESLEKELVDVITQVFDKVFHIQFEEKREILLHLVDNTLHNVEKSKSFRFRVSEDTRSYLEEHIGLLREQVGQEAELSFVTDTTMQNMECSIETDSGVFDCSVDVELSGLIRDIKSLCI